MTYQQPSPEIPGWMSAVELEWLYQAARRHDHIAEIGCWMGRSTHALCSGCTGTVNAIDTFKGTTSELDSTHVFAKTGSVYAEFRKNTGQFKNLEILQGDSEKMADAFCDGEDAPLELDMIFIDADHSHEAVLADLRAWWPKLKPGGLFCGHDVYMTGVVNALQVFSAEIGREVVVEEGTIWSIR